MGITINKTKTYILKSKVLREKNDKKKMCEYNIIYRLKGTIYMKIKNIFLICCCCMK